MPRRGFVKGAAVGAGLLTGAGALAGCGTAAPAAPGIPAKWDREADVVIVGAGGRGIVAAIEAADAGSSVLVLEKAAIVGGTTSLSGAVIQASNTDVQRAGGVEGDTPEQHYQYWLTASGGQADPVLVKVLADNAPEDIQWLMNHRVEFRSVFGVDPIPYIDPNLMVNRIHVPGPPGCEPAAGAAAQNGFLHKEWRGCAMRSSERHTLVMGCPKCAHSAPWVRIGLMITTQQPEGCAPLDAP